MSDVSDHVAAANSLLKPPACTSRIKVWSKVRPRDTFLDMKCILALLYRSRCPAQPGWDTDAQEKAVCP